MEAASRPQGSCALADTPLTARISGAAMERRGGQTPRGLCALPRGPAYPPRAREREEL